jgi:hypothetical protein
MQDVIETAIRLVGIVTLKLITFGRYEGQDDSLVAEGGLGLLVIAALSWCAYYWWPG